MALLSPGHLIPLLIVLLFVAGFVGVAVWAYRRALRRHRARLFGAAPDAWVHGRVLAGPDVSTPCCEAVDEGGRRCVLYAGHDEGPRPTRHTAGPFPDSRRFG